jgi:NAD(P)-dependent dehydrogenase (short-subunit alcohol dehydrogenase family)
MGGVPVRGRRGKANFMNLSGKRALVTGAAGSVGSHLVRSLLRTGDSVRAFVRYTSTRQPSHLDAIPGYARGAIEFRTRSGQNLIAPGTYIVGVGANETVIVDWIPDAFTIDLAEGSAAGETVGRPDFAGKATIIVNGRCLLDRTHRFSQSRQWDSLH